MVGVEVDSEEGSGGFVGGFAVAGGFVVGQGVFGEDGDGALAGVGGFVIGAADGRGVEVLEEGLDGGLIHPGEELVVGELVGEGDGVEGAVGVEEIGEECFVVDGDVIDLVVDLGGGIGGG